MHPDNTKARAWPRWARPLLWRHEEHSLPSPSALLSGDAQYGQKQAALRSLHFRYLRYVADLLEAEARVEAFSGFVVVKVHAN